jgi:DNA-binding transcriptional regulator GbsR (MarR family)
MNYLPVDGHPNLVRDVNTGAIISKDRPTKRLTSEFNEMKDNINSLKNEISEIKSLLKLLIENGNNP